MKLNFSEEANFKLVKRGHSGKLFKPAFKKGLKLKETFLLS